MALNIEQKKAIVTEVAAVISHAQVVVAAEYRGLSVQQMTELRAKGRENDIHMRVVKNTLARRAIEGTVFSCLKEALNGPLVLVFSQHDPGAVARVIVDFTKDNEQLVVKAISIGGQKLVPSEIFRLAKMPTKEQAIGILMSVMQAPIALLARTLAEPYAKLARTLVAVQDQKQAKQ